MLQKMQLVRGVGISAALAFAVVMSGCGKKDSVTNNAPSALFQFGQANFNDTLTNRNGISSKASLAGATSVASNIKTVGGVTTGVFLIADTGNNRILGFKQVPTSATTAADFVYGQDSMDTNVRSDLLNQPSKISFSKDGTQLLVVDSGNNRVLVWKANLPAFTGTAQANINVIAPPNNVIGNGSATVSSASLSGPTGASFAPTTLLPNRLAVADKGNHRVLIYDDYTAIADATTVLLGQRLFADGPTTPNCPQNPSSVPDCTVGTGLYPYADTLRSPTDVWSDGSSLLISDTGNNRVLYFTSVPAIKGQAPMRALAATNVIGQSSLVGVRGPNVGQAGLNQPQSLWVDPNTKIIYVADFSNNRVLGFSKPQVDGQNAIFLYGQGDYSHITADDDDQNGLTDHPSNNNSLNYASARTLFNPSGMTTVALPSGSIQLFIADTGNNRLTAYNTN